MSKPYAILVAERAKLPQDVLVKHIMERMTRWAQLSSSKQVSLDEVAWMGALMDNAIRAGKERAERQRVEQDVKKQLEEKAAKTTERQFHGGETHGPIVHNVTLTDGVAMKDAVGG